MHKRNTTTLTPNDEWVRLQAVIEWKGMSTNYFAHYIGLSNSFLIHAIKHGSTCVGNHLQFTPTLADLADRIVRACPEIDREWLATGKGTMFREKSER